MAVYNTNSAQGGVSGTNSMLSYGQASQTQLQQIGARTTTQTYTSEEKDKNKQVEDFYQFTHEFKDVTSYRLMRGVPDFGSLVQFNPYETGYACFIVCSMPRFMVELAKVNPEYNKLVANWQHIIEYEFKSFDGLEDMTADTYQLGDDLNNINIISRVNKQAASEFSLTYDEKMGTPLMKFHELYLSGIKDPRTQVKTYNGLIHSGKFDIVGFENEVFTFLFIATDNTMRFVERAVLIIGAQLNSADTGMFNYTKGDINKHDTQVKFSGYPIMGNKYVDMCAQDILNYLMSAKAGARQIVVNSNNYEYTGLDAMTQTLAGYGANLNDFPNSQAVETMQDTLAGYNTTSFTLGSGATVQQSSGGSSGGGGSTGGGG